MFNISKNKAVPAAADSPGIPEFGSPAVLPEPRVQEGKAKTPSLAQSLASTQKPSVVSEGFLIKGDIESEGILHVEGSIIGTIQADDIYIGAGGMIDGRVTCKNLNVKGKMLGKVVCDELVVAPSAKIKGEISYQSLTIGSGASLEGEMTCRSALV